MKKIFALCLCGLFACSGPDTCLIEGSVEGVEDYVRVVRDGRTIDSVGVVEGRFRMEVPVEEPMLVHLMNDGTILESFYLEPGTVRVEGTMFPEWPVYTFDQSWVRAYGTPSNDAQSGFSDERERLMARINSREVSQSEVAAKLDTLMRIFPMLYMERNLDNLFGIYRLGAIAEMKLADSAELHRLARRFTPAMQRTQALREVLERRTAEEESRSKQTERRMTHYVEVELPDTERRPIRLSDLIEREGVRYVLVDFWATWCSPCMEEIPYLLETYDACRERGFEIYAVSMDSRLDRWRQVLGERGIAWVNVCDPNEGSKAAKQAYGVKTIPSNFLVDCATGKVVATDLRGDRLGSVVGELLEK